MNVVQIEDTQQHIRVPLHVIREHNVTIPLEVTIDSANKLDGYLFMGVAMRVPHVGSLIDQYMVQNGAVAVGSILQLFAEVRQILHVIPVYLGVVGFVHWDVAVMRRSMPRPIEIQTLGSCWM
jgi:hypothetical protein